MSPGLGRFVSPDPIVPDLSNPQAWNRYAYVANNPLKFVDPSGHCWGFASGLRGTFLGTTCGNFDLAGAIIASPDASLGQKALAGGYIALSGAATTGAAVGGTILASKAAVASVPYLYSAHAAGTTAATAAPATAAAAGGVVETAVECTLTGGGCTPADYALGASTAGVASRASSPSRNVRQAAWASGERSGFLIHFTDETGYRGIIKDGFSMNASPAEKTAPSGIYFTEAMPFNEGRRNSGPYDPMLVRANVGIDLAKTQYYIVIDPTLLPNAQWRIEDRYLRLEHILMTDVPFDISSAVIIHGPTSDLNP